MTLCLAFFQSICINKPPTGGFTTASDVSLFGARAHAFCGEKQFTIVLHAIDV